MTTFWEYRLGRHSGLQASLAVARLAHDRWLWTLLHSHSFYLGKALADSRDCQHYQGQSGFTAQIAASVGQGLDGRAHAGALRIGGKEDKSRQKGEDVSAQYPGNIALNEAVFLTGEQAG